MDEPKAALDAIISPSPLTLGKYAILVRLKSPVLNGDVEDLTGTLIAIYVYTRPVGEAIDAKDNLERLALEYAEGLTPEEYRAKLSELLDAIAAFYEMLPRPEDDSKKNSVTDSSPNSSSGE